MPSNGHLPRSALARVPGNGWLRKDAARAYTALDFACRRKLHVNMALIEGELRRTYREFSAQVKARNYWCGQGNCGNAAVPGTSNHGLGITVDLMSQDQRRAIDRLGAPFGWSKRWSDAQNEWWHIKFDPSHLTARLAPRTIRLGSNGPTVARLQRILRSRGFKSVPRKGKPGHGYFGRATKSAVKRFQKAHGLKPDGVVGVGTWAELLKG